MIGCISAETAADQIAGASIDRAMRLQMQEAASRSPRCERRYWFMAAASNVVGASRYRLAGKLEAARVITEASKVTEGDIIQIFSRDGRKSGSRRTEWRAA
jgi:hypothetical protein